MMTQQGVATSLTRTHRDFWLDFAIVGALFGVVLVLYAASLRFPFVWFDADDLVRSVRYSPAEILAGMPRYPYYRPLIFLFWKLILTTWGPNSAPIFHAYLVGAHFFCAVLLFKFVSNLARNRTIAAAAALLFATYPFSYQAITWSTAQSHPTNLALVLVSAILYQRARERDHHQRRLYFAAAVCLIIAMLVHESAYVGALLILGTELYLFLERRVSRLSVWPALYFVLTIGIYFIYRTVSKSAPAETTLQFETGLYLLQGLIYPVAMLFARACTALGCDSAPWLLPAGVLLIVIFILLWRSGRTLLLGLFGLIWFGLEIMPVWAGRDYVYIHYAPRLLYSAAAGAAVALAALLGRRSRGWQRIVMLCVLAIIALQGFLFVKGRDDLHATAFRLTDEANQALFAPRQGQAVFVNVPELYTYRAQEFPLGWYGVMVAPWHNRLGAATDLRAIEAEWVVDPGQAQQVTDRARPEVGFHGQVLSPDQLQTTILSATQVFRVEVPQSDLQLFQIGQIERNATPPTSTMASWSGNVRLISATVDTKAGVPVLNLNWFIGGPIDPGVTVFVHVLNEAGQVVAQADGDLVGGYVPIGLWSPNDRVQERRPLLALSDLLPGQYHIVLGLYNRITQQRLEPASVSASLKEDALSVGEFDWP
jgi:hypothetical protein